MKSILLRVYCLPQNIRRNFLKKLKQPDFACTYFEGGLVVNYLLTLNMKIRKRYLKVKPTLTHPILLKIEFSRMNQD